jgi:phage tail sheath protein FI
MELSNLAPGVYVEESQSDSAPIRGVGTSTPVFIGVFEYAGEDPAKDPPFQPVVDFVTNFSELKNGYWPDPTKNHQLKDIPDWQGWLTFVHAVFGFFQNGGTGCYVTRARALGDVGPILDSLAAIDDIEVVVAPGVTDPPTINSLTAHCSTLQDRVAIVDLSSIAPFTGDFKFPFGNSDYAAAYAPYVYVTPLTSAIAALTAATNITPAPPNQSALLSLLAQLKVEQKNGKHLQSPSGHAAGVWARVDATRGVHKAPANEVLFGASDVAQPINDTLQGRVNQSGVNCIRFLNGNIRLWGARTVGGAGNESGPGGDFTYIHVRRLFNFIRSSVIKGTQWAVFEPNTPEVWAKLTRNVRAFLRELWERGALFGDTEEQAFFIKCDEETNPPDSRSKGELHAIIGVNITQTAEFVIFQLGEWEPAVIK